MGGSLRPSLSYGTPLTGLACAMFSNCALFISYNLRNPVSTLRSIPLVHIIQENFEGIWLGIVAITLTQTK